MTNSKYFEIILNKVEEIRNQFKAYCEKQSEKMPSNQWLEVKSSLERSTKKKNGLYYYYLTIELVEVTVGGWYYGTSGKTIYRGCFHSSFNMDPVQFPSELGPYKKVGSQWREDMEGGLIPLEEDTQTGEVELKYTPSESSCQGRNKFGNYRWAYLLAHGDIDIICGCDVHVTSMFVREIFENRKLISRALCEKMAAAIQSNGLWINESNQEINWKRSLKGIMGVKVK